MSLIDAKHLKNKQLIIQYLIEQRQSGHGLPYDDYITINQWIKAAPSTDHFANDPFRLSSQILCEISS